MRLSSLNYYRNDFVDALCRTSVPVASTKRDVKHFSVTVLAGGKRHHYWLGSVVLRALVHVATKLVQGGPTERVF